MPALHLITNAKIADIKAFSLEFSKFSAETLSRREGCFSIIVTYNETLTFAGTFDPAFNLRIDSLDNINRQANDKYSKAFFHFFQQRLGVPESRGYITFIDPGRENMSYEGTTFATILGEK